jgi:hypothetical protein
VTCTCLYRLYGPADELLYVGISKSALLRLGQHLGEKPWADQVTRTTIDWYDTREAAAAAEVAAIVSERPLHNITHNSRRRPLERPQGWPAEAMPDMCHDHCVKQYDEDTVYFPHTWVEGRAQYICERGHEWTCGWGHSGSGTADLPSLELGDPFPETRTFSAPGRPPRRAVYLESMRQHARGLRPVVPGDERLTPAEVAEIRRILSTPGHVGRVLVCLHEQVKVHLDGTRKCRDCGDWIGHPDRSPA